MKRAIVIGATGLIGSELVRQLAEDATYSEVRIFARKKMTGLASKFSITEVNFDDLESFADQLRGDVLFSTLGTTLKTAGSKEAQYKIDFNYQFEVAKRASDNGVRHLVLLSSAGADAKSAIFYSRMKGELDLAVQQLGFEQVSILRPSMLVGKRKEFRLGERIFTPLAYIVNILPFLRKYRPIRDRIVAQAMRNAAARSEKGCQIYELEAVFRLAKSSALLKKG